MSAYRYTALRRHVDGSDDTIRLMYLLPGKFNDPLCCKLDEVPIQYSYFSALSYVWGTFEESHIISVYPLDAADLTTAVPETLKITPNLETALRYLRYEVHLRVIWVDAICINQDDDDEKLHQIKLMAKIYHEAYCCLVWLGPPDSWTKKFFRFARAANRVSALKSIGSDWTAGASKWLYDNFVDSVKRPNGTLGDNEIGIKAHLHVPWFSRLWTLQEMLLSRRAVVVCGYHTAEWTAVRHIALQGEGLDFSTISLPKYAKRFLSQLAFEAIQLDADGRRDLPIRLLLDIKDSKVTKPADKILGALAIFERIGVDLPYLDYSMSLIYLQAHVTFGYIKQFKKIDILGLARYRSESVLPSWVIDLQQADNIDHELVNTLLNEGPRLRSEGNEERLQATATGKGVVTITDEQFLQDSLHLRLKGKLLPDEVVRCVKASHHAPSNFAWDKPGSLVWFTECLQTAAEWFQLKGDDNLAESADTERTQRANILEMAVFMDLFAISREDMKNIMIPLLKLYDLLHKYDKVKMSSDDSLPSQLAVWPAWKTTMWDAIATSTGRVGLGFCNAVEEGDRIALIAGADYPMVLRKAEEAGHYRLIGLACVSGLMEGEEWPADADAAGLDDIILV